MKKQKNKTKEQDPIPEIKGEYNDFLIVSNPNSTKKSDYETPNGIEEKNENNSKYTIIDRGDVETYLSDLFPQKKKEVLKQSRFSNFFKEMEENKNSLTQNPLSNSTQIFLPSSIKLSNSKIQYYENKNPTSYSINSLETYYKLTENNTYNFTAHSDSNKDLNDSIFKNEKENLSKENNLNNETILPNDDYFYEDDLYEKFGLIVDMCKVLNLEDTRTTIMIKNIPNKFTRDMLINIIDQNFRGTYDIFILPTDSNKFKNFGYAFINFTNSYYIPYFYFMFHGNMWSCTNSKKVCEITYSKIQGKSKLLKHYPSKIIYENEEGEMVNQRNEDVNFIIPIKYKDMFTSLYPNHDIMVFPYYFLTLLPTIH